MEMSSPLAAMHPPQLPGPWGYRRHLPPSKPLFGAHCQGPKNFNFRDLSMKKPSADYFNLPPMRGSSPTASLAADMSSNLHMDQSPQLATPRRSLFTTNIFQQVDNRAAGTTTPPIRWEGVTTPPIPSSSPFVTEDSMDISPLPHKAPYSFTELTVPSPSPAVTPATSDEDMISPCEVPSLPQFPAPTQPQNMLPRPVSATGRRKSIFSRPSLLRTKHNSTNTVSFKPREVQPCPPFQFNAGPDSVSASNSPVSLDDCFAQSPPQERRPFSNPLQGTSKPKSFGLNHSFSRANGSPLGGNVRKPVGPTRRPSKVRRSLSMFENPCEVMNAKQETDSYTPSGLQSVMDVDDTPTLKLPHFVPPTEPDSLPRITSATLVDVLNGVYDDQFDEKTIVDCRFEYEYDGGHIKEAINHCDKEELAQVLFSKPIANRLVILHCEYSAHRAPLMAKFVRQHDRRVNCHHYPHLTYPEVYILDGGYSAFYASHRNRCEPQDYLQMDAPNHEASCEKGMNKLRQRSKLNRAQTFAYGMQTCQMEDSPTAAGRSRSGGVLTLGDDIFNVDRSITRRLASY